jgi:hypothetical protein
VAATPTAAAALVLLLVVEEGSGSDGWVARGRSGEGSGLISGAGVWCGHGGGGCGSVFLTVTLSLRRSSRVARAIATASPSVDLWHRSGKKRNFPALRRHAFLSDFPGRGKSAPFVRQEKVSEPRSRFSGFLVALEKI